MKQIVKYFLFPTLLFLKLQVNPLPVFAQLRINCGGVKQIIPSFKEDSAESFTSQDMVKRKALVPITESKSEFEIRVYLLSIIVNHGEVMVIKCTNNKIEADRYIFTATFQSSSYQVLNKDNTYKNINGTFRPGEGNFWLKKTPYVKLNNISSWNAYFTMLIKNHLYDMPSEKEFDKIMRSHYHNIIASNMEGGYYVELKVGNHYRNFISLSDYNDPVAKDDKLYNSKTTIFNLFNQIKFMK